NSMAWLSTQSFAYLNDKQELYRVQETVDHKWSAPEPFKKGPAPKLTKEEKERLKNVKVPEKADLVGFGTDTVFYREDQSVWRWTIGQPGPQVEWSAEPTNSLFSLDFDANRKLLRIAVTNSDGLWLKWYSPASRSFTWSQAVPVPLNRLNAFEWF